MLHFLFRSLWRIIIFLFGIGLVWLAVRVYPYADARLPAFVVFFLIYIFFAYIGIPALIRLWRVFIKPNHIPLYATTGDGWPSDPVNIAIIAHNKRHLIGAMEKAGWYVADDNSWRNAFREGISILLNTSYPHAPFSKLYLFGRPFDIGFQIPTNKHASARSRHHVRFWRLEVPARDDTHNHHYWFWNKKLKHLLGIGGEVWIGAAIEDVHSIGIRWRSGQLTHRNNSNVGDERDLIVHTLTKISLVRSVTHTKVGQELKFRGQQAHNTFVTDGSIQVIRLKKPGLNELLS